MKAASQSERLVQLVMNAGGWLPFEQFMAAALYHPEYGYYTSQIRHVGRRGDFTTSASNSHLLGQAIAGWLKHQKRRLKIRGKWHVIEVGGGSGELAQGILQSLGMVGRLGLTYHLVEISQPLRQQQMEKLRGRQVIWHNSISEALHDAGEIAPLFSNELVDAFPCKRLRQTDGVWHELGLAQTDQGIQESSRPLGTSECADMQSVTLSSPEQDGPKMVEVQRSYRDELNHLAKNMARGVMLTIDYGDRFPDLYYRQPAGTVRGYFHHLRVDGEEIYTRIGRQDITADVNFSDLENWGNQAGFKNEGLETQREFILKWLGNISPKTTGDARLLDPIGAGSAFKVLQQSKGVDES